MVALLGLVACASRPPAAVLAPKAGPAIVVPPVTDEETAALAAKDWLATLDRADFAASWAAASPLMRSRSEQGGFVKAVAAARTDAGAFVERKVAAAAVKKDPPEAPPGTYARVTFDARFAAVPAALETVTLHEDDDGRWRMVGYRVDPAPCTGPATPPPTALPAPPASLGLDPFYAKYLDGDGIPIVSSARVRDEALFGARTILRRMLHERPDIRARLAAEQQRVVVMAPDEQTLDVPEQKELADVPTDTKGVDWNARARGLGGTLAIPVTSVGEENLLGEACDRYRGSNVLVHELAHAIQTVGLVRDDAFQKALADAFARAKAEGRIQAPYPASSVEEYWAVGAQSWFDANVAKERRSRADVKRLDPALASLLGQVFEDDGWRYSPATPDDGGPIATSGGRGTMTVPKACRAPMVSVNGGRFAFGAADDVHSFCMDPTEVTVDAYAACVKAGMCTPAGTTAKVPGLAEAQVRALDGGCNAGHADRGNHPVNCVDWPQAAAYCKAQGKRLPTEQEWEWAARSEADARPFPWGTSPPAGHACWSGEAMRASTCEVGAFPAGDSTQGIHDLAGNVWEWTSDPAPNGAYVQKGGGFATVRPTELRATLRDSASPGYRAPLAGFRCVK
jgi:hypothetical protein